MITSFDFRKLMQADGLDCGSLRALHEPREPIRVRVIRAVRLYFGKLYTKGRGDIL